MNVYFAGMLVSMIIYLILGAVISRKVKDVSDFFVAGRQAPTILIVGSLVASYCSTGLFMGDVGEAFAGFFTPFMITAVMLSCGYILGSVFFGKYLRRSKVLTIPEFFAKRFNSRRIRVLAALTAIITMVVYLLSVMQGIGTLMNYVTGVDYNICILLALITFTILTVSSGSKGVLITDTLMFGIFTISAVIATFVIVGKLGGWYHAVDVVTKANPILFSWHGDLSHLYPTGVENMIWAVITGLTWITVCAIAPWQSSRYLMAKNEHTVVRSSIWASLGVFTLEFLMPTVAVLLNAHNSEIPGSTYAMIWAAQNLVPTVLGVIMLTGVLAAGISSATTFLSLIGSSVVNDLFLIEDDKKKLALGRIAILVTSAVVMILAYFNPPQIYIIMLLSGTVVTCAWLPDCIASVWSKKVTEAGAFYGMLLGFIGCAAVKLFGAVSGVNIPIYFDSFFVGLIANVLAMIIGSKLTKVTKEETEALNAIKVIPIEEYDEKEIALTKKHSYGFIVYGVLVLIVLIMFWVIPYYKAL